MSIRKKKATRGTRKIHIIKEDTPFIIKEAYKTARTNLMFSLASSERKIIAFTSANPSEGKSTNCVNMALTLASTGSSVLLIDADLRKPTVHKYFKLKNGKGLSSVLGYFSKVQECIHQNVADNLDIMTSGAIPPNPSELLSSKAMTDLLEVMSEYYDYILIDTPPINTVTDSQLMNKTIAGFVFVVKESSTRHADVAEALRRISLAEGKVLGFLKINCNFKKSKKQTYNYSY